MKGICMLMIYIFVGTLSGHVSAYGFGSVQRLGKNPLNLSSERSSYNVTSNGTYCIEISGSFLLSVVYNIGHNKTVENDIKVPRPGSQGLSVSGYCKSAHQHIKVNWGNSTAPNKLEFEFVRVENGTKWSLASVNASVTFDSSFKNASLQGQTLTTSFTHLLIPEQVPLNHSYACRARVIEQSSIASVDGIKYKLPVRFDMKAAHILAFNSLPKDSSVPSFLCLADEIPRIVPIAIGCVLLGMVLIVLFSVFMRYRRAPVSAYQEI